MDVAAITATLKVPRRGSVEESPGGPLSKRKALAGLLQILATADTASANDVVQLSSVCPNLVKIISKGRLPEAERVSCVYGVCLCVLSHVAVAVPDEVKAGAVVSLLSTVVLCGVVGWGGDTSGWLHEIEGSTDPLEASATSARCKASVVVEAGRVRRRVGRLAKLLEMDPATIAAALRWKAKMKVGASREDDEGDDADDGATVSTAHSFPSSLLRTVDGDSCTGSLASGSTSGHASAAADLAAIGRRMERALESCNLFSPGALRHAALVALAVIQAHCARSHSVAMRQAFAGCGGLEASVVAAYFSFHDQACLVKSEKEAVALGQINYDHQDQINHDHQADDAASQSGETTASGATLLNLQYQEAKGAATAAAAAEAAAAAGADPAPALSLVEQARAHLSSVDLIARAGGGQVVGRGGKVRHGSNLADSLEGRALGARTAMLGEALLAQAESGELVQLATARTASTRKMEVAFRVEAARAQERGRPPPALPKPYLPDSEWIHPLRALDRYHGAVSAGEHVAPSTESSSALAFRRSRSLVHSLKCPDSPHFLALDRPIADLVRSVRPARGSVRVLQADAKSARQAAGNRALPLRERLAAAVAGARVEKAAELRASHVSQQEGLDVYSRSTLESALLQMSGGGGSTDLASRLTTRAVTLAEERAVAEAKRAAAQSWGGQQGSSEEEDDGDASVTSGVTLGSTDGSSVVSTRSNRSPKPRRSRRGRPLPAAPQTITVEQSRAGVEGRLETEVERRARLRVEHREKLMNREAILEQKEQLEMERLLMVREDKRSARLARNRRCEEALATIAIGHATSAELSEAAEHEAKAQRKGLSAADEAAKAKFRALKEERAAEVAAAKVGAKQRAATEAVRLADIRSELARERAEVEAAEAAAAAAAAYKARRKEVAAALEAATAAWEVASDLHERRGVTWGGKNECMGRLRGGGFKLIDGELRWRDEDTSRGWYEAGDPRHHATTHPLLRTLLTKGSVKPWRWHESMAPQKPEEPPVDDSSVSEPNEDDGAPAVDLLSPGSEEIEKALALEAAALLALDAPSAKKWAHGRSY